jgi:hypothetical protein
MRAQFVPVVYVYDRQYGLYKIADWLQAGYLTPDITTFNITQLYTLKASDCPFPELLSYKFYGTTDFWWVLCWINGVINPMTDMIPGDSWGIPSFDSVQAFLAASVVGSQGVNQVGQVVTL